MAMWHGFFSGTDSAVPWVRGLYILCGLGVLGSVTVRLTRTNRPGLVRHTAPAPAAPALVGAR
jgi:hypothetical protein